MDIKNAAGNIGRATLGVAGLGFTKDSAKAAAEKKAGPQTFGQKSLGIGKTLLKSLLGPVGLLFK